MAKPKTKEKKSSTARQTTLFGLPSVPPPEKKAPGRKPKATNTQDDSQQTSQTDDADGSGENSMLETPLDEDAEMDTQETGDASPADDSQTVETAQQLQSAEELPGTPTGREAQVSMLC